MNPRLPTPPLAAVLGASLLALALGGPAAARDAEPATGEAPETISFKGFAYEIESGAFLYTEEHERELRDGRMVRGTVLYRAPDGTELARKMLDFGDEPSRPTFRLDDTRDGYAEGARVEDDRFELYYRRNEADPMERELLDRPERLVIDAGFDAFVQENFAAFLAGDEVLFDFAVPTELDAIPFRARPVARTRVHDRAAIEIELALANRFFALFVDPIVVSYDVRTKELLRFAGLANINDPEGKSYVARIEFPPDGVAPHEAIRAASR